MNLILNMFSNERLNTLLFGDYDISVSDMMTIVGKALKTGYTENIRDFFLFLSKNEKNTEKYSKVLKLLEKEIKNFISNFNISDLDQISIVRHLYEFNYLTEEELIDLAPYMSPYSVYYLVSWSQKMPEATKCKLGKVIYESKKDNHNAFIRYGYTCFDFSKKIIDESKLIYISENQDLNDLFQKYLKDLKNASKVEDVDFDSYIKNLFEIRETEIKAIQSTIKDKILKRSEDK